MNYILETKAFYDWLEVNQLSTSAIALWHALMHIANKTGWKESFSVAQSVLMCKTGLKETAFKAARTALVESGRITYKSRGGNLAAVYSICSLCEEYFMPKNKKEQAERQNESIPQDEVNDWDSPQTSLQSNPQTSPQDGDSLQSSPQTSPQSSPQSRPQTSPINKQNNTKQNDNNTPLPPFGKKEESTNKELNEIWLKHRQNFSKPLEVTIKEWIRYKKEKGKGKSYQARGLNSLLTQIKKKVDIYGETVVIDVIELSMANNYQGIMWDKMEEITEKRNKNYGTVQKPKVNRFVNYEQRNWDFEELERLAQEKLAQER